MGKFKQGMKKIGKWVGLPIIAAHLGLFAFNQIREEISMTDPQVVAYKQKTGIQLEGTVKDMHAFIREQEKVYRHEIEYDRQCFGSFPAEIRIEPGNYFLKNPLEQLAAIFGSGHSGYTYAFAGANFIVVNANAGNSTRRHETKHWQAYQAIKKNPELQKRWKAIQAEGYKAKIVQLFSMIRFAEKLVDDQDLEKARNLGFVTVYARSNPAEDIAETAEELMNPESLDKFHKDLMNPNSRLRKKADLLIEARLIPPDTISYAIVSDHMQYYPAPEYAATYWNSVTNYLNVFGTNSRYSKNVLLGTAYKHAEKGEETLSWNTFAFCINKENDPGQRDRIAFEMLNRFQIWNPNRPNYSLELREIIGNSLPKTPTLNEKASQSISNMAKANVLLH